MYEPVDTNSTPQLEQSAWQREQDGRTAAVLHEVLGWVRGEDLARAGRVCRAWRRAAAAPALWRRLLLAEDSHCRGRWRQEYVCAAAGWSLEERVCVGGSPLHAALAPGGGGGLGERELLALVGEEDTLQVWERGSGGGWRVAWSAALGARGWRAAVRVHWAPRGDSLLVVGDLALVDSWELLVFHRDESGGWFPATRARCSAGAAGCWMDATGSAFLSLELSVLAPRLALTTVWLNSSSQETKSEYAGVRALLLRIFNEDSEHITCCAVAEERGEEAPRVLVAGWGCRTEGGGALGCWALGAVQPPPLLAAALGDLRERVSRRARRPPPPPRAPSPPPPDEGIVRALCEPPAAECSLPAPPTGLVLHPSGAFVWVSLCGGGAWCGSLPGLAPLRLLPPPSPAPVELDSTLLHYVQPALSDTYFASPQGARSGGVSVWCARSGVRARAPPAHPAPALAALLSDTLPGPSPRARLLVLAGHHLYVWRSRATRQPLDECL